MIFVKPEALDELAELILVAAAFRTVDGEGKMLPHRPDISKAPDAAKAALDVIFGPDNWAPSSEWPRPEQMNGGVSLRVLLQAPGTGAEHGDI